MDQAHIGKNALRRKICFVTIGATASFDALIEACLDSTFLSALATHQYSELVIQYGKEGQVILDRLAPQQEGRRVAQGMKISGFDFKSEGLNADMRAAKGRHGTDDAEGVVISHAG